MRNSGDADKAIAVLKDHIATRLEDEKRPSWENPYFYELEIGDIYLNDGRFLDAVTSYESAEQHAVEKELVADRYRAVAEKLHEAKRYDDAINLLKKHRELDPLLFDAALDLIAKEAVKAEQ